ncbi:MAG TPA: tetratricopeptide repeat protein, partial [Kofleriaceae bacterium]|nr:tetratricopeptide repeat protein [Kofleriaceae bacterium]
MSMRDDITPTNPEPIEVLSAQLEAFKKDPSDADLYFELRVALRKSGQAQPLAEIGELHAPHQPDRRRAADIWSEAGEARLLLGHDAEGERDLRHALEIDPANERAAARLTEQLMVAERFADTAEIMEAELAELSARADDAPKNEKRKGEAFAPRRAHRHRMLAQLWDERLGRVDRALHHWQRAWQLEPDRADALEAARAIYAALGDENMVARLYEAELELLGERGPKGRRAIIERELGRIHSRQGDAMAAAGHLEVALRLDPDSNEAREALAEIYASPAFEAEDDRQRRASELFVDLGKRRLATQNDDEAIAYLRRAMGVDPYSDRSAAALEQALTKAGRWDELDRLYRHLAEQTDDEAQQLALLNKRGRLYSEKLDDPAKLKEILRQLAATQPPGNDYSRRLRELYTRDEDWKELAALIDAELPPLEQYPDQADWIVPEMLELSTIYREHLGDRDRGAETLHRILSFDPYNPEAAARYADHFRERRDWRGLSDLLEFAFDNARERGASAGEQVRQLEEIAQVSELRLGDIDRAIRTWSRIQEIEPGNVKAREAVRRLASRAKMWQSLVGVLEQEAAQAQSPHERAEALRRIAQVYRERQVNPRRAIALYEDVLTMFPDDDSALKALSELYDREGDDAGLAATLRRQLELDVRLMFAEAEADDRRPATAREWPVAKRVERLTSLRRLATMYEQRLADVEGVVFACTGILEILPGDRDALDRMERVLEKAGDIPRLEQTLEYHASSATGPAERAKVLRRLASLAADRNDEVAAMDRWEQVVKSAPGDRDALAALGNLYERHKRWGELAQVLERTLMRSKAQGGDTDVAQLAPIAAELVRYARVVDHELGDTARAMRAWQNVLDAMPHDREALEALARLHEGAGRWRDLAEILAKQAPLYIDDEPEKAAQVALQRARLLEERLGAPAEATKALEAIISDLDPANLDAHQALRRLYEARGDFEAAVRIAEREMYLTEDEPQKISRGLEIGLLCRDRLTDPTRALQAFERVLSLKPDHEEALSAAAELYAKVGDWKSHLRTLERRIEKSTDNREKRALMTRIAHATAEKLGDHKRAFRWFRQAHELAPDATTIGELRRAAEAYGLWRELADVYEAERTSLTETGEAVRDVRAYVSACRDLAAIAERRLNNRQRALGVLLDAIKAAGLDEGLLSEAERIALEANQKPLWKTLLECLAAPLPGARREAAVALHARRARVLEERLEDDRGAVEELLKAFSKLPEREETRQALYEVAERTRAWNDVVAVEQALFERARTYEAGVTVLRRKAHVLEENLKERVRAFRVHLSAFLLAPEDADTIAHLWRLARAIDRYREADRRPRPEPPAAYVEPPQARQPAKPRALLEIASQHSAARTDSTEELTASDVMEKTDPGIKLPRQDRTMPIDISDLMPSPEELADFQDEPGDELFHAPDETTEPTRLDPALLAGG